MSRSAVYKCLAHYRAGDRDAAALNRLDAHHVETRPYTPHTNGKTERFVQTGPHSALHYKPPILRLATCEQRPC